MRETISILAAVLTTISFVPQAYKTIKTRDTSGISLAMYVLFVVGVIFWFAYGIMREDPAIYLANGVAAILGATILAIKLDNVVRSRRERSKEDAE